MSSYKQRMIRLRDAADSGDMDATDFYLVRNLRTTRLGGNYTEQSYANGQEGAKREELFDPHAGVQFELDGGWGAAAGTAPRIAAALKACGLTETIVADTSVTYAPTALTATYAQAEIALLAGDQVQDLGDCRGALSFTANAGQRAFFNCNFMGAYTTPAAATWPAPDISGWKYGPAATPANMQAFTVDGITLCVTQFSFTDGRSPQVNKYMNCPGIDITMRRATGQMQIKMPDIASMDLVERCKDGVTYPLVWEINATASADGAMRIAGPKVQMKWGGEADIDGELGANIDLVFLPDQGDDDYSIIFKAQE